MNEEPLDLRALAHVDEPDVLREALRTFRRRLLTRYVWITVGIGLATATAVWGLQPATLSERMDASGPTYQVTAVWHLSRASVGLARVVDLGDTVGMHFVVLPRPGGGFWDLEVSGTLDSEVPYEDYTEFVEAERTSDGRYSVKASFDFGRRAEFTIDLSDPKYFLPPSLWKETS
jgi:hypothetical protein